MTPSEHIAGAVASLRGHQLLRPKYLVFESTSHCQFTCEVCGATPQYCSRRRGLMDWDLFRHLVEQAVRLRPERVCLHAFGEPLLHPRIVDMVELRIPGAVRQKLESVSDSPRNTHEYRKLTAEALVLLVEGVMKDSEVAACLADKRKVARIDDETANRAVCSFC